MAGPAAQALQIGALSGVAGISPKAKAPSFQQKSPAMDMTGPATLPQRYQHTPS